MASCSSRAVPGECSGCRTRVASSAQLWGASGPLAAGWSRAGVGTRGILLRACPRLVLPWCCGGGVAALLPDAMGMKLLSRLVKGGGASSSSRQQLQVWAVGHGAVKGHESERLQRGLGGKPRLPSSGAVREALAGAACCLPVPSALRCPLPRAPWGLQPGASRCPSALCCCCLCPCSAAGQTQVSISVFLFMSKFPGLQIMEPWHPSGGQRGDLQGQPSPTFKPSPAQRGSSTATQSALVWQGPFKGILSTLPAGSRDTPGWSRDTSRLISQAAVELRAFPRAGRRIFLRLALAERKQIGLLSFLVAKLPLGFVLSL